MARQRQNGDDSGDRAEGPDIAPALGSPLEHPALQRLLIIGGPLGLLVALLLGLWVSSLGVEHSVVVQVDQHWVPGDQLAIRTQALDGDGFPIEGVRVGLTVSAGNATPGALGELEPAPDSAIAQGIFEVPDLPVGDAALKLEFTGGSITPFSETVPVRVVERRPRQQAEHVISSHQSQRGNETGAQLETIRIVMRPVGRVIAGFRNAFLVRVTNPDGTPWSGPAKLLVYDGEFMGQRAAGRHEPTLLVAANTDALGLLGLEGPLASEVIRFLVRIPDPDDPDDPDSVLHERRFQFTSYAGAVAVDVEPKGARARQPVMVHTRGLRAKRPIFVDVFDHRGAWIDTFQPPVVGRELPRRWQHPRPSPGTVQFQAYHFTNDPGESTGMARVQLTAGAARHADSLEPLIRAQRAQLEVTRVERDYDVELERAYLDALAEMDISAELVPVARQWLLGTLPVRIHAPPTALSTRPREDAAMAAERHRWKIRLRWLLLGGGSVFLLVMTLLMLHTHGKAAEVTLRTLQQVSDAEARAEIRGQVRRAKRAALMRGLGVIGVMAAALVLTLIMLENLL